MADAGDMHGAEVALGNIGDKRGSEIIQVASGNSTGDTHDSVVVEVVQVASENPKDVGDAPSNTSDKDVGDAPSNTRDIKRDDEKVVNRPPASNAGDSRNYTLVVCTLIAAVTFQTGICPPGGVWQETTQYHRAGTAVFAAQKEPYYLFLIANSLAFSSSLVVMAAITYNLPFWIEIWFSMCCMLVTYVSAFLAVNFPGSDTASFNPVMFIPIVFLATYILIKYCNS